MCLEHIKAASEVWLAFMTTALALFTLWLVFVTQKLFKETKRAAKKQLGVNTWLHFIDTWDLPTLRNKRRDNANFIMHDKNFGSTDPVLDFFEQVGTVYGLKCINRDLVYSSLSYDAENWWLVLEDYVISLRKADPSYYVEFEKMVDDIHKTHPNDPLPTLEEAMTKYLKEESELL